ncbi:MAG TPA: ABC transporter ATP-binding protein [Acidimicrobiia bacterium]|nr:ABC transporter ATP-binding protein [Acidimicrobiia bacterium]
MSLLEVSGLAVAFDTEAGARRAVDDVTFSVDGGERVALVGESGSGKTVTGLALLGLIDPPGRVVDGSIRFDDRELDGLSERDYRTIRGREIAMVFQDPMTALNPSIRIGDQVAESVLVHDRAATRATAATRARDLLALVGVSTGGARERDYPHQLSGGMRQRVVLAMALANEPRLLVADEPTTALDVTTQAQILELLDHLRSELGLALLFVTHDLGVAAAVADRVVVMYAGRVVESAAATELFSAPRHPYTRGLIESSPRFGTERGSLPAIPGQPPGLSDVPAGCAFHPRCGFAEPRCAEAVPPLESVADGHEVACVRVHELPAPVRR